MTKTSVSTPERASHMPYLVVSAFAGTKLFHAWFSSRHIRFGTTWCFALLTVEFALTPAQSHSDMDDKDDKSLRSSGDDAPDQYRLRIVSFGRANGPLAHPPAQQLLFSVRDLPSPPARLCKTHTGLSSHLRKEVLANKGASERLVRIENSILQEMSRLQQVWQSPENQEVDIKSTSPQTEGHDEPRLLQVGIFCDEGRHRSVSFVHELARCSSLKQQGWTISVIHRDLGISDAEEELLVPTPTKLKKKHARNRRTGKSRRTNSRTSFSTEHEST